MATCKKIKSNIIKSSWYSTIFHIQPIKCNYSPKSNNDFKISKSYNFDKDKVGRCECMDYGSSSIRVSALSIQIIAMGCELLGTLYTLRPTLLHLNTGLQRGVWTIIPLFLECRLLENYELMIKFGLIFKISPKIN